MFAWTLQQLSTWTGASEAAVRVLIGLLSAYPLLLLFRSHLLVPSHTRLVQHLGLFLGGLVVGLVAIGPSVIVHNGAAIALTFVAVKFAQPRNVAVAIFVFAFQLLYLFVGYLVTARNEYTIVWTLPQCVLALRLAGLAIDVFDEPSIAEALSWHELLAFAFFPGGYLAGPQFSIRKFRALFKNHEDGILGPADFESADRYSLQRFFLGLIYFIVHIVGSAFLPEAWPISEEFETMGFVRRSFWFTLWAKFILAKYIGVWLMAEGACALSTLSFVKKEGDKIDWSGMANVNVFLYERCCRFQHLIESFNINTNAWSATYVFKRMKFLGNKDLSVIITLFFLAFWHGYHSGYYVTFLFEFLVMAFEKDVVYILDRNSRLRNLIIEDETGRKISNALGFFYVNFFIPNCFCPFALLTFDKYAKVTWTTGAVVPIFFGSWQLIRYPVKAMLATDSRDENKKKT